jgi:hypothetical protein
MGPEGKQESPNAGPIKSTSVHFRLNTYIKRPKKPSTIKVDTSGDRFRTPELKSSLDQDGEDTTTCGVNGTPSLKRALNKQHSQEDDVMNKSLVEKRVTRSSAELQEAPVFMVQAEPNKTQLFEPGWHENLTAEQARCGVGIYQDPETHTHTSAAEMRGLKITTEAGTSPNKSISNFNQDSLSTTDIHEKKSTAYNVTRTLESTPKSHPAHVDPPQEWCDSLSRGVRDGLYSHQCSQGD